MYICSSAAGSRGKPPLARNLTRGHPACGERCRRAGEPLSGKPAAEVSTDRLEAVITRALGTLTLLVVLAVGFPSPGSAEQASQPGSAAAAGLDSGRHHTCALLSVGRVRCWGFNREGELGYANTETIGDDETPASAGPVDLGAGRTATAISAGDFHTCALLDDATVRCWGFGANGRLGTGSGANIGDGETPGSIPPVRLGAGRTARALSSGGAHTCAVLDDGSLRCWGFGFQGALGYGSTADIGDDETPDLAGPVDLGAGHTAKAVSGGDFHTCALLEDSAVRCWGFGANGQLGYASGAMIGDDETPAVVGPVDLGTGRTATAISAGGAETCAGLDDASVRCWGFGREGRLGYGNLSPVGDDETPGSVGPVNLGAGRTATAISVGDAFVCARLDSAALRCWGSGRDGRLGYANTNHVGDDELPGSLGPVDLGAGRSATAISLGSRHACARLENDDVRCWGYGGNGRLGICNELNIGDTETPAAVGPVDLGVAGTMATACAVPGPAGRGGANATPVEYPRPRSSAAARRAERRRARRLRSCMRRASRHARGERNRARGGSPRARARGRRHRRRHLTRARRGCLKRHGRTPGRVTRLAARAVSGRRVELSFNAPGSHGSRPPAARGYLVKQSLRPIRSARGFRRAQTLCGGSCRFSTIAEVGGRVTLDVRALRPRTTYFYAVAARDNVSHRLGARSRTVKVRTR